MKTIHTILAIIFITSLQLVNAQSYKASSYVERTHLDVKVGTTFSCEFRDRGEIGAFYQKSAYQPQKENVRQNRIEQEFYGAFFSYPIRNTQKTSLKFNTRIGVSNNEYFVITPCILASYIPVKNLSFTGGVGIRAFIPTLVGSVALNLNNAPSFSKRRKSYNIR